MIRKSYNALHADWVAKMRAKNPEMAALFGTPIGDALERAAIKAFGVAPQDENERYAAAECLDARQCVKGRGED